MSIAPTRSARTVLIAVTLGVAVIAIACRGDGGPSGPPSGATRVDIVAGERQVGLTGRALAESLVVKVSSSAGAVMPGAVVNWTASAGTVSSASTTTDKNGMARAQWIIASGDATMTAAVAGATSATLHATGRASGACQLTPAAATTRFSLGPTDYTLSLHATAPLRVVVLFADFPNAPATETATALMNAIVTPGLQLLRDLSYGRLSITATPVDKWYRMSQAIATYDWRTFAGH